MMVAMMNLWGARRIANICMQRWFIGDWSGVSGTNGQFIPSNVLLHDNILKDVSLTERLENTSLVLVPPECFILYRIYHFQLQSCSKRKVHVTMDNIFSPFASQTYCVWAIKETLFFLRELIFSTRDNFKL